MNNKFDAKTFKEIMDKFNEYREKWINKFGNDYGFNEWFNIQVGL